MFISCRNLGMPSLFVFWLNFPLNCCEASFSQLHVSSLPSLRWSGMVIPGNLRSPFRLRFSSFLFSRGITVRPWERILWLHLDLHTSERTSVLLPQGCSFAVILTCFTTLANSVPLCLSFSIYQAGVPMLENCLIGMWWGETWLILF